MALLRMTDKKLAANRANARLSRGPATPAGKEKVSRNACKLCTPLGANMYFDMLDFTGNLARHSTNVVKLL